jgi:hypothetical protein
MPIGLNSSSTMGNTRNAVGEEQVGGLGNGGLRAQRDRMPTHDLMYRLLRVARSRSVSAALPT